MVYREADISSAMQARRHIFWRDVCSSMHFSLSALVGKKEHFSDELLCLFQSTS